MWVSDVECREEEEAVMGEVSGPNMFRMGVDEVARGIDGDAVISEVGVEGRGVSGGCDKGRVMVDGVVPLIVVLFKLGKIRANNTS